jgi:hypothetical protein
MVALELFTLYCKSFMLVLSLNGCGWNIFLFKKKKKKEINLLSKWEFIVFIHFGWTIIIICLVLGP